MARLAALALSALLGGCAGSTAPELAGNDLDGKPLRLSDFRGKVVVLDFWSST
jgi:hypothetical protein